MSTGSLGGGEGWAAGQRVECNAAHVSAEEVLAAIVRRHGGGTQRLVAFRWAVEHLKAKGWTWDGDAGIQPPPPKSPSSIHPWPHPRDRGTPAYPCEYCGQTDKGNTLRNGWHRCNGCGGPGQ